jgi:hypothetical protein
MTTNTYAVIDAVTRKALQVLRNRLGLGNRVLREFDDQYGQDGAKIGDTLRVRKPIRVNATSGPAAAAQNFNQTYVPVAAQNQNNVIMNFTTKDLELDLDSFSEQVLEPIMAQLASTIDTQGFQTIVSTTIASTNNTLYNGVYAGFQNLVTPGNISATTGPASWTGAVVGSSATNQYTALIPFLNAQARLTEQAADENERFVAITPAANAATIGQVTANMFDNKVSERFDDGIIMQQAGAKWFVSQNIPSFTTGAWTQSASCQVSTTSVDGATTLVVKGFGNSDTIVVGDQFVVSGIYSVNPLNRTSTGILQVFTVIGGTTNNGSGGFTLSIAPTINSPTSPQYQTVNALPTANQLITMMGTSGATTQVNIMYQKQAVAMVNAPLADVSDAGAFCVRVSSPEDKLSLRYVKQYQASSDQVIPRVDILTGWQTVRPELGVRIQG